MRIAFLYENGKAEKIEVLNVSIWDKTIGFKIRDGRSYLYCKRKIEDIKDIEIDDAQRGLMYDTFRRLKEGTEQ